MQSHYTSRIDIPQEMKIYHINLTYGYVPKGIEIIRLKSYLFFLVIL